MSVETMERAELVERIREDIHKKFPDFKWPTPVLEPIYYGRFEKTLVDGRQLIMDADTGKQWAVVSNQYEMIPHELVLHSLLNACPEHIGTPEVKLRMWKDGAVFRADATFPNSNLDSEIRVGDMVRARISRGSSYDTSTGNIFECGGEQLVCGNGCVAFVSEKKERWKHIGTLSEEFEGVMRSYVETFIESWTEQTDTWKRWAEQKLKAEEVVELIETLPFTENEQKKILQLPLMNHDGDWLKNMGDNVSLWDINSAATQMAKHEIVSGMRATALESQIAKVLRNYGT